MFRAVTVTNLGASPRGAAAAKKPGSPDAGSPTGGPAKADGAAPHALLQKPGAEMLQSFPILQLSLVVWRHTFALRNLTMGSVHNMC